MAADAPLQTDTAAARAEGRKEKGNEAFKEGNYPQAAVFYTQTLELAPIHYVALANRSACFLKMAGLSKICLPRHSYPCQLSEFSPTTL